MAQLQNYACDQLLGFLNIIYIASSGRIIAKPWIEKDMKGRVRGTFLSILMIFLEIQSNATK
jgi:hypothetical protein